MKIFLRRLILFISYTSFSHKRKDSRVSHDYRLKGFLYVYEFKDGGRTWVHTSKWKANHVSGYGVSGIIIPIMEMENITLNFKRHYLRFEKNSHKARVKKEKDKYKFLKSLPTGLTESEYDDKVIDWAFGSSIN